MQWSDPPPLRALRAGLDWANLLFDRALERRHWQELCERDALELEIPGGKLALARSGGRPRGDVDSLSWSGEGLFVRAVSPERFAVDPSAHAARVDVQGLWCSGSMDGLRAVEGAREAVQRALWPDGAPVPCVGGRMDLFCDVEVGADEREGSRWVEREVFRSGNQDRIFAAFATRAAEKSRELTTTNDLRRLREGWREARDKERERANATTRFLGGPTVGRTRVLGRDPRMMTYEADRDPGRDKIIVRERWRSAGWDGERRVVRTEVRVSRDWFVDNELELENGERLRLAGEGGLSWDQVVPHLPAIARAMLLRTRETDVRDRSRHVKDRRSSPLWLANLAGIDTWAARLNDGELVEWDEAPAILARRRALSIERSTRRLELAAAELYAHAHAANPAVNVGDVALSVGGAMWEGDSLSRVEKLDERARRTAIVCGLPVPPSVSWLEQQRQEARARAAEREGAPPDAHAVALAIASASMTRDELDARLRELDSRDRNWIERIELGRTQQESEDFDG